MSWALNEFFAAVEEEFGVPPATPRLSRDTGRGHRFRRRQHVADRRHGRRASIRDHVAGVVGEIMARTLGVTRYEEASRFVQDLHVR